jgi:FAD/FMN-containing dehydrogenase
MILGLEVVLADGTVLSSMNRMLKNNSGYDLKQLFIGTEGTLGVITKAVVRLEPVIARTGTILLAVPGFDGVTALLQSARRMLGSALQAFELMWGSYYDALTGPDGHSPPMERGSPYYVLVETALPASDETMLDDFLTSALEDGLVTDGVVAQSEAQRARIWKVRDDFDAILRSGDTYLFDVSLPIAHMHDYVDRVRDACHAVLPDAIVHVFGHIGDGNLHLFVTPRPGGTASKTDRKAVDECVYAPLGRYGGAISAEHGIGREKRDYLPISRTDAEIDLMRRMKRLLDPDLILNPGLVVKT